LKKLAGMITSSQVARQEKIFCALRLKGTYLISSRSRQDREQVLSQIKTAFKTRRESIGFILDENL